MNWRTHAMQRGTVLDVAIGARIRSYRVARKLTQTQLGHAMGVTFQQVQKYEKGVNRVSGSRLVEICKVLNVRAEQLLGNGHGVYTDEPDVLELLRNKDMLRMFAEINRLPAAKRRAVTSAVIMMIRAFEKRV